MLIREIRVKYFRFLILDVSFGGWDDFNAALRGHVLPPTLRCGAARRVRHPRSAEKGFTPGLSPARFHQLTRE